MKSSDAFTLSLTSPLKTFLEGIRNYLHIRLLMHYLNAFGVLMQITASWYVASHVFAKKHLEILMLALCICVCSCLRLFV